MTKNMMHRARSARGRLLAPHHATQADRARFSRGAPKFRNVLHGLSIVGCPSNAVTERLRKLLAHLLTTPGGLKYALLK